jgi:hypothetical protein
VTVYGISRESTLLIAYSKIIPVLPIAAPRLTSRTPWLSVWRMKLWDFDFSKLSLNYLLSYFYDELFCIVLPSSTLGLFLYAYPVFGSNIICLILSKFLKTFGPTLSTTSLTRFFKSFLVDFINYTWSV